MLKLQKTNEQTRKKAYRFYYTVIETYCYMFNWKEVLNHHFILCVGRELSMGLAFCRCVFFSSLSHCFSILLFIAGVEKIDFGTWGRSQKRWRKKRITNENLRCISPLNVDVIIIATGECKFVSFQLQNPYQHTHKIPNTNQNN